MAIRRLNPDESPKIIKRLLPHTAIMTAVFLYTVGGGYIFYWIEHPHRTASLHQTTAGSFNDTISDSTTAVANSLTSTTAMTPSATLATSTSATTTIATTSTSTSASATSTVRIPVITINGLQSWLAMQKVKDATSTAQVSRFREPRQLKPRPIIPDDDYEDEDDLETAEKRRLCSRHTLSTVVESARKECVLADAPVKNKNQEFRAHLCASLLAHLSSCILKPNFKLEDATVPSTAAVTISSAGPFPTSMVHKQCESAVQDKDLTPSSYIFMAFTIISTIGYGHVAPVTTWGRVFCIVYGLFGIPLALLAVADQGRFLSAIIMYFYRKTKSLLRAATHHYNPNKRRNAKADIKEDSEDESMPALLLLVLFGFYMLIGGAILTPYEKSWSYIDAVYFTFISSSSIGFGDLLPQEGPYLPLTLLYVALGLALSTAAIDVFAGYLRKLHHWGKKIRNCANKLIWFGGEKVTLSQLIRNIGVQLGVPEEKIKHLVDHFDEVVATTIQQAETGVEPTQSAAPLLVEEPPPPVQTSVFGEIDFIDDKEDVA